MLTLNKTPEDRVTLGAQFLCHRVVDYSHQDSSHDDPIAVFLRRCEFVLPNFDIGLFANLDVKHWPSVSSLQGFPPEETNSGNQLFLLSRQSYLHDIWSLFRGKWNEFGAGASSISNGEQPVRHPNIFGHVELGSTPHRLYSVDAIDRESQFLSADSGLVCLSRSLGFQETGALPVSFSPSILGQLDADYLSTIRHAANNGEYDYVVPSGFGFLRDFRYDLTDYNVRISYIWAIYGEGGQGWRWDVLYVYHDIRLIFNFKSTGYGTNFDVNDIVTADVITHIIDPVQNELPGNPNPNSAIGLAQSRTPHSLSWPYSNYEYKTTDSTVSSAPPVYVAAPVGNTSFFDFIGYDVARNSYYHGVDKELSRFRELSEQALTHCIAGCFVSSHDAISSHYGSLTDSDMIENLLELGDILAPLDLVKALFAFRYRGIGKGLDDLLQFLADAKLTYSFGVAPTISDAEDVSAELSTFREKLAGGALGERTSYGRKLYTVDNPSVFGEFSPVQVSCRSKLRLRENGDSLLPYILQLDGAGFLPDLSTAWNLIPFSFVVDWFFKVGNSIEVVEDSILARFVDVVYSTHSITIVYKFNDVDMYEHDFGLREDQEAGYKYYGRWAQNKSIPIIQPTILPITGNVGIPDLGIAGALLYKLK